MYLFCKGHTHNRLLDNLFHDNPIKYGLTGIECKYYFKYGVMKLPIKVEHFCERTFPKIATHKILCFMVQWLRISGCLYTLTYTKYLWVLVYSTAYQLFMTLTPFETSLPAINLIMFLLDILKLQLMKIDAWLL